LFNNRLPWLLAAALVHLNTPVRTEFTVRGYSWDEISLAGSKHMARNGSAEKVTRKHSGAAYVA